MQRVLSALVTAWVALSVGAPGAPATDHRVVGVTPGAHVVDDLDGDGRPDRFDVSTGGLLLTLSSGGVRIVEDIAATPTRVATLDVDGDGDRDLVATSGAGRLHLWRNDGAAGFSLMRVPSALDRAGPRGGLAPPTRATDDRSGSDSHPVTIGFARHVLGIAVLRAGPPWSILDLISSQPLDSAGPPRAPPVINPTA
jgi:hypothetical protein